MAFEKEVQDFTAAGTDLPESKLSTGFIAGERPPANWFNSLFSRTAQAIKELQAKAVEKEYVDEKISEISGDLPNITEELNEKAEVFTFTSTIPTTGWNDTTPYYVDIAVAGLLATDIPHIVPVYTGAVNTDKAMQEAWNKIDRAVANTDSLRVYAFSEIPTTDISIQIEVVR